MENFLSTLNLNSKKRKKKRKLSDRTIYSFQPGKKDLIDSILKRK